MSEERVTGEILLPKGCVVSAGATAHVQLLDTSMADAPSMLVAEQVINDIAARIARGEALTFELHGQVQSPHATYSVRVHIDQKGDGKVDLGDFVNKQSYPVITFGYPSHVVVQTAQVV